MFWANFNCFLQLAITSSGLNADRALCGGCTVAGNTVPSSVYETGIDAHENVRVYLQLPCRRDKPYYYYYEMHCEKPANHFISTHVFLR